MPLLLTAALAPRPPASTLAPAATAAAKRSPLRPRDLLRPWLAACGVMLVLGGCGGGFEGTPSPIDTSPQPLSVAAAPPLALLPSELRSLSISGGTRPYTATSSNPAAVLASVSDGTLRLAALQDTAAPVTVTVSDAKAARTTLSVTVGPAAGGFDIVPRQLSLAPGDSQVLSLQGGTPPFAVRALQPHIATATVQDRQLTVTARAEGVDAELRVTDSRGLTQSALVQVSTPLPGVSGQPLAANWPSVLAMRPGQNLTYTLGGGTPPYGVTSDNPAAVQASVRGAALILRATAAGRSTVTVSDAAGNTLRRTLTVASSTAPLALMQQSLTGVRGTTADVLIAGGLPPYTVLGPTAGTAVATASIVDGSVLRLQLLNAGGPTLYTVRDAEGQTASLSLTVTPALSQLSLSPAALTVSELSTTPLPLRILGGKPPYLALSTYPNLMRPRIDGDSLTITPIAPCVDLNTKVIITVIDATGAAATSSIEIQDNGPCPAPE